MNINCSLTFWLVCFWARLHQLFLDFMTVLFAGHIASAVSWPHEWTRSWQSCEYMFWIHGLECLGPSWRVKLIFWPRGLGCPMTKTRLLTAPPHFHQFNEHVTLRNCFSICRQNVVAYQMNQPVLCQLYLDHFTTVRSELFSCHMTWSIFL